TREVFEERVLEVGCETSGAEELLEDGGCIALRTDGVSNDIDGDYTETLARVASNPDGIGVFGLAFYENNTNTLQVATMDGIIPTVESISTGEYPVSRPLFFYMKKAHLDVIPGLKEFAMFFVSDEIAGPTGPLAQYGLVSDPELASVRETIENETVMN
ncbi:PstS family phosphate ABC transporter substrate-binding protein, partial [Yoonia sp.]|uniref:PstS family phosphate ABC transporter substrate-binding protein n=1 Tax=Yoonia sp. TaxID=2212373 RepID=UPI003A4DEE33